jgi:hypothetical protein
MFCQPSDPKALFDTFWNEWTDDFVRKGQSMNKTFTEEQLKKDGQTRPTGLFPIL